MNTLNPDPVSFMAHAWPLDRQDTDEGPLAGVTAAVKDLYNVKGIRTGGGNPAWLETHPPATNDAAAVAALLDAGARLVGKTLTDEMAYSLIGANHHYGTPPNPAAPDRVPGGSSSGSASVVAQGLADIALGTDTGGSVRIPASFCGLFGLRPTHGRIATDGLMPLAASFDTVGWFARDAALFETVGDVLLTDADSQAPPTRFVYLTNMFAATDPATYPLLDGAAMYAATLFQNHDEADLAPDSIGGFAAYRDTYRYVQGREAWQAHGAWVRENRARFDPLFGPGIVDRFTFAEAITDDEASHWQDVRAHLTAHVFSLLGENRDSVLCMPTAPGPAPIRGTPDKDLDGFRMRILDFTAPAAIAGVPQVTIPVGTAAGGPVGLSLIGAPGTDRALVRLARVIRNRILVT